LSWRSSSGLRSWLFQRLSALYILGFLLYGLVCWLSFPAVTYEAWRAWVAHPVVNIALALFFFALLLHMWVGGRDIAMDYLKPLPLRYIALTGFGICLLAMAFWSVRILFTVTVS
jgi:succinate dehydrogenase / fumarate reductase membrane anchor subunit